MRLHDRSSERAAPLVPEQEFIQFGQKVKPPVSSEAAAGAHAVQAPNPTVKAREERRRLVLPARMRSGLGWNDACILNISLHGLMIYSKCPVELGSKVELHRGAHLVTARVVWRNNHRIGLCSPEPLPVEAIISSDTAQTPIAAIAGRVPVERRKRPRDPERSRDHSRAIEFVSLVLVGTIFAGGVAVHAQQALTKPLAAVQSALGSR